MHRHNKSMIAPRNERFNSNTFSPDDQLAFEIQREKNKISRFLLIKENQTKSILDRERIIEQRAKAVEKRV